MSIYAVINTGGKQYRVQEGDKLAVERISTVNQGDTLTFDEILLVGEGSEVTVGSPKVEGATVTAEVIEQGRAAKVIAFKFKRRKGFHKTKGHRQLTTKVKITGIQA